MAFFDVNAGATLIELREGLGLSPEALAKRIAERARRENWDVGAVDAWTIREIEGNPAKGKLPRIPKIRVQVVMAMFYGVDRRDIWKPGRAVERPTVGRVA